MTGDSWPPDLTALATLAEAGVHDPEMQPFSVPWTDDGLGAEFALSAAFTDNPASLAVSRKLGYREDGIRRQVIRGRPAELRRLRLDRGAWQARREDSVAGHGQMVIEGLEPCLPMFGLTA